jgi:hypothetical protein
MGVVYGVLGGLLAVLTVTGLLGESRRRSGIRQLAADRGWSLVKRDRNLPREFTGVPFGRGRKRRARNVLRGERHGRRVLAFDYTFQTGDESDDVTFWVACVEGVAADGGPHATDPAVARLLASWPDFPWRAEDGRLLTWGKGRLKSHWLDPALNMLTQLADALDRPDNPGEADHTH